MAKDRLTDTDLPSAVDSPLAGNAPPVGPQEGTAAPPVVKSPVGDKSLPLFHVTANKGLEPLDVHAVDESDAIRQFYFVRNVKNPENYSHRAVRA